MNLPRVRFRLRSIMILILVISLLSALVVQSVRLARRERELAALRQALEDYQRAVDRLEWAERMNKKGYVPQTQLKSERQSLQRAEDALRVGY
jgi:type II secretory pathway pseudopilin PulG